MARCRSAKVIGVRNGAIPLAAAVFDAATLHSEMTSGVAAGDGRTDAAKITTAMSNAAMLSKGVRLIRNLQFMSVILATSAATASGPYR